MRTILTAIALFTLLSAGNSFITAQNAPDGAAFPIPRILKDKTPDSGSFWASARCDITDLSGRISFDYHDQIPGRLEIASLNDGNYILTIETAAGRFSELFRKLKIR